MARRILIPALAAAALAALPASGARAAGSLTPLKIGDAAAIAGTSIGCYAINSNKKNGIVCLLVNSKGFKPGSFGVGLAVDGTAVINKVKADGSSQKIFKKRLPAARAAAAKTYSFKPGEGFGIPVRGDEIIACEVVNVTSTAVAPLYRGIKVSCHFATSATSVANTYGVSISDKYAGVYKVTPQHTVSSWGVVKQQPR